MMKKLARRIFSVLLAAVILICSCPMVNAASVDEEYEERRERAMTALLDSGWTEEDIADLLTEEELMSYADVVSVENSEKKYFRVSEESSEEITYEECQVAIAELTETLRTDSASLDVTVSPLLDVGDSVTDTERDTTGYLEYYVKIYYRGKDSNGRNLYKLQARFEWLVRPTTTYYDIFAIINDQHFSKLTDPYFIYKADYVETKGISLTSGTHYIEPTNIHTNPFGAGISFNLYSTVVSDGYSVSYNRHYGYMSYETVINESTVQYASASAYYVHQTFGLEFEPSFTIGEKAVGVTPSATYQYELLAPNPEASIPVP